MQENKRVPLIIGLCGKMGSGKNYISENYVMKILEQRGYNFLEISLADQIKVNVMTKENIKYDELYVNKSMETRTLLQYEGTENGRKKWGEDIWIRYLDNWISIFGKRNITAFIIPDIRFKNEMDWIKNKNGILIKVLAPKRNEIRLQRESNGDPVVYKRIKLHQSEVEMDSVDNSLFDLIVQNDIANEDENLKIQINDCLERYEKKSELKTIVQKYGGTSVGTPEKMEVVVNIIKDYNTNICSNLYVVVSAISDSTKSQGTTSLLLQCMRSKNIDTIKSIIKQITDKHLIFAKYIKNKGLEDYINKECENILSILEAAFVIGELTIKSRDIILSIGERLSAKILTEYLCYNNIKAEYVENENSDINIKNKIIKKDGSQSKTVKVFGGYPGYLKNGVIETVGRGYSDYTAGIIASNIQADELQIWKEVEGIFTADPNIVLNPKLLTKISKEEIAQLTYYGCQAVNPLTIDIVKCPIRIKNCKNPDGIGTLITNDYEDDIETKKQTATAVTIKDNITVINISSNKKSVSPDFFACVFDKLRKNGLIADLISTSQVDISIAVDSSQITNKDLIIRELEEYGKVDIRENLCVLSLIGKQMIRSVGIASKMFKILSKNKINIEMISQGSSEINISCVVEEKDATKALCFVHHEFIS